MTSYGEYHVSVLELYLPSARLVLECVACVASVSNRVIARKLEWKQKKG